MFISSVRKRDIIVPVKNGKIFGFDKNIFWMGLTSFLTDAGSEMIHPILPIFLSSVLGVNKAFIGLIEGIAEATASLLKVVSGWLSDKLDSRKEIIVFGYSLSTIAKPLLAVSSSGWHVLTIRFFDRLGKGLRGAPRDALISGSCKDCDLGRSFGFHRAMDSAGAIAGPALLLILMPLFHNDFRSIFLISSIPAALAVIVLILFVRENKRPESNNMERPSENINGRSPLKRDFVIFLTIFAIFTLGNSSDAFLILRAQDLNIGIVLIPLLWIVFNSIYTLSCIPAGRISDILGRKNVLIFGLAVYSIVYFGFGFSNSAWHIWVLFAMYGIYYGMTEGVSRAYIAEMIPQKNRGTAYGIYGTTIGVSSFFASIIMGIIWQTLGATAAFSFGGALSAVAAILLIIAL